MRALSASNSLASLYTWIYTSNVGCWALGKERSMSGMGQRHYAPGRLISKLSSLGFDVWHALQVLGCLYSPHSLAPFLGRRLGPFLAPETISPGSAMEFICRQKFPTRECFSGSMLGALPAHALPSQGNM